MTRRRPEFQFRVARCPQLQQVVIAAVVQVEADDGLRVTAVEALGQPKNRRQRAHDAPFAAAQIAEADMPALRRRLAMIARGERDDFNLVGLEAGQIAVLDQIVRVFVVSLVADMHSGVVKDCGIFEPFALAIGQAVNCAGLIEERDREPRDLLRMFGPVVAALRQLEHAPAPHVRIAVRLRNLLPMPRNVVEHQTFAQRQVAQGELGRAQPPQDFVHQNGPGDREVGAARLEAGDP